MVRAGCPKPSWSAQGKIQPPVRLKNHKYACSITNLKDNAISRGKIFVIGQPWKQHNTFRARHRSGTCSCPAASPQLENADIVILDGAFVSLPMYITLALMRAGVPIVPRSSNNNRHGRFPTRIQTACRHFTSARWTTGPNRLDCVVSGLTGGAQLIFGRRIQILRNDI